LEEVLKAELSSERFMIKSLTADVDELKVYLSWMRNKKASPFIQGVNENFTSQELIDYILEKNDSKTALLLGIFVKPDKTHIGNIKLEIIIPRKSAAIGILIGEEDWRGKGVGLEVMTRVLLYCFKDLKLETVELGVNMNNIAAINLYSRIGFIENTEASNPSESTKMSIQSHNFK
jgi:RimJ/RimL family protein N-acetyltransferase